MADPKPLLSNEAGGGMALAADIKNGVFVTLGVLGENVVDTGDPAHPPEKRISMTPQVAAVLIKDGYGVNVQSKAGIMAGISDEAYTKVGCKVMTRDEVMAKSEVLLVIDPPIKDFPKMRNKVLIAYVSSRFEEGKKIVEIAVANKITLLDVTMVPRITIAQKLDVLSSQAKVAGHRAVVEASHAFGRFHTAEMTAAGKYPPSNTFILGCGVAGLAAIGTSKALGSVVSAWDVRDVSDQVESMGAKWVKVDFKEDGAGAGGYAKESSDEFKKAQQETFKKELMKTDIAISTAAIPGRPSPKLILKDAVEVMKPGSVIVDLAAVGGGNCDLTKKDEMYTTPNGVTIIGYTDLAARMAMQSSTMYAQNMSNLLGHISPKEKAAGLLKAFYGHLSAGDSGDIVTRSIVCCRDGSKVEMPPPPQPTPTKPKQKQAEVKKAEANPFN